MAKVLNHDTLCQRNDYVFSIILDTGGAGKVNLQYTRLVSINFPFNTVVDF